MAKVISRRRIVATGLAAAVPLHGGMAQPSPTPEWPTKTIRIVVTTAAGGITDVFARAYGDYIMQKLGQPVVVENRTGAGGSLAAQFVKDSVPDGHTLLYSISSTFFGNRVLFKSLPYDPEKDFALVAITPTGHLPLIAHASTGATDLKQFIDYARRNKVTAGSFATGSLAHIIAATLNREYGLEMGIVQYRGESPMWQDLLSGSIQLACGSYQAATSVLDSGAGRAIAVPTSVRMRKLPEVATFVEQGFTAKAFNLTSWTGLIAPAGVPPERLDRLSTLMVEAGTTERVRNILDAFGVDTSAKGRAEFQRIYDTEGPVWIEAVRQLGLTPS